MQPETLAYISKMMRPGVAEAISFCPLGIPAARRNSRERTLRLDASSSMTGCMARLWRGCKSANLRAGTECPIEAQAASGCVGRDIGITNDDSTSGVGFKSHPNTGTELVGRMPPYSFVGTLGGAASGIRRATSRLSRLKYLRAASRTVSAVIALARSGSLRICGKGSSFSR